MENIGEKKVQRGAKNEAASISYQRPSLRSETHPIARQNAGTLNSSGSKSMNGLKFLVLSTLNLSLAFFEHFWLDYFENYNRIVVMHLICGEHPLIG